MITPAVNPLTGGTLDRVNARRKDPAWVAARRADPDSRFLLSWRYQHLVTRGEPVRPVAVGPADAGSLLAVADAVTLLGVDRHGAARFALDLPAADEGVAARFRPLGRFAGLRETAPLLAAADAAELAHARAMTYWHRRTRHCGDCGRPTETIEGGHARRCTGERCGRLHFPRTDPAVIVAVVDECDRCLLGRQARWPEGMYSTLAGFVDPGESLEEAVVREVQEESGVAVSEVRYHSSQPWPFPRSLMVGFLARARDPAICLGDDELADARWFSRRELADGVRCGRLRIPSNLSISYRLIETWYDRGTQGPLAALTPGARIRG